MDGSTGTAGSHAPGHYRAAHAVFVAIGMTTMLFGEVGHGCWQTPQPMQPRGFTATRPAFNSIAADPNGHLSMQIVQESPLVRRQLEECQTAVPMSMSLIDVGSNAPLGQT